VSGGASTGGVELHSAKWPAGNTVVNTCKQHVRYGCVAELPSALRSAAFNSHAFVKASQRAQHV
jgi:hypothetical protein